MKKESRPLPKGKYAVGTFTYTVDSERSEVLDPSTKRHVACRVYYPVTKESVAGMDKVQYMSRGMVKGIKSSFKVPLNYDKLTASGENVSEAYENAPRIPGEKFPLIVFSHGYQSFREGNSYLLIELASQGYVVISVAHSKEGILTEFDDGSTLPPLKGLATKTYQPFLGGVIGALKLANYKGTNREIADKFDQFQDKYCNFMQGRILVWKEDTLEAVDYARKNLADLIDFDKGIGASGHSFGGDLAYLLCASEPDYVCGINIDGGLFGDYKNAVMDKPFMQISCRGNETIVARAYLRHTKPVYKVLFRDMRHVGFSDMKFQISIKSLVGTLDSNLCHDYTCASHLEFFDAYLKCSKSFALQSNDAITVTTFEPDM